MFFMSMLLLLFLCIPAWDALINGKLYYCTDGGTMDFILGPFGGGWVHNPESVPHVVPRPMEQPDEIKTGWSITGLWCLWGAFVGGSVLVSALFAGGLWRAGSPNPSLERTQASRYGRGKSVGFWRLARAAHAGR